MVKFKLVEESTLQEIFNFVCKKLIAQGRKSLDGRECRYRSSDGLKCAVGHMILDSEYIEAFEGKRLCNIIGSENENEKYSLLSDLQTVHDDYEVVDWKIGLRKVAEINGLMIPNCIKK